MNRQTLTEQDLATMTGPELVALHNNLAASLGDAAVKRFATKADAIRRTWAKVQAWKEKQQEAAARPAAKQAKAKAKAKGEPKPRPRRGTDLKPTGEPVKPCLIGSKQAVLVDQLRRKEGATMAELLAALAVSGKPWQEQTVRSGFGWDLKRKGYGVRSTIGPDGVERFHLVVPAGQKIPPHVARGSSKAEG
ncbi:DUF3489 domain-containing protein [Sulfurivermis fontis]|uniref:DUF3489 domain-containing protein n=1 Tax=Sulfurivermis fontis TaxID=1972068 RepID=UPI000FD8BE4D|nr:DUF3489 domain-containing protein [Sulfurivermis fontis]